ncbi:MAG: AAA-associated domain-containing protein [Candidatus Micrarchaeota archaeon]
MNKLPEAGILKVIGLLEVLHDRGGEDDTVQIVDELHMDVESLLPVTEAAELLGFITISGGKIKLTEFGNKIVKAGITERKRIVKDRLLTLDIFRKAIALVEAKKARRVSKKVLVKAIRAELIREHADKTVARIIDWGRHAGLLGYDSDSDELYLIKAAA